MLHKNRSRIHIGQLDCDRLEISRIFNYVISCALEQAVIYHRFIEG